MFKNPFFTSLDGDQIPLTPVPYNEIKQRLQGIGFQENFFAIFEKKYNEAKASSNSTVTPNNSDFFFFQPPPLKEPSAYESHNMLLNGLHYVLTQDKFSPQQKKQACTDLVTDFFNVDSLKQVFTVNNPSTDPCKVAEACIFLINTIPQNDLVLHVP